MDRQLRRPVLPATEFDLQGREISLKIVCARAVSPSVKTERGIHLFSNDSSSCFESEEYLTIEAMMVPGDLRSLDDLLQRPRWHAQAACRELGPNLFFPTKGGPSASVKAICDGCAVQSECLEAAMSEPDHLQGVWAGTSQRQRRMMRRSGVVA